MSQRTLRINQLLLQEFSAELHSRWRQEAVRVTFTRFSISDDLRSAVLTYSVAGDETARADARRLLRRALNPIKAEVFKRVPIKYTPEIRLVHDESPENSMHILDMLDSVAREDAARDARHGTNAAAVADADGVLDEETEDDGGDSDSDGDDDDDTSAASPRS